MTDDPFSLDDWLNSVDGETVRVTAPGALDDNAVQLISKNTATPESMLPCAECEDRRMMVEDDDGNKHCPVCGAAPRARLEPPL